MTMRCVKCVLHRLDKLDWNVVLKRLGLGMGREPKDRDGRAKKITPAENCELPSLTFGL